ncbi:hypothetical protein GGR35_000777 [Mucilaginibacter phyllosphaerae]|uniref:Uncharacterized protein n=1 Tax=Mucilaginibacter phyllosphaerae TaxID=1812349 RepID=A0ABR6I578_9SPHI|nr:hypothetical protein [Mucilaginibacter phyllosphaerae]
MYALLNTTKSTLRKHRGMLKQQSISMLIKLQAIINIFYINFTKIAFGIIV